MTYMVHKIVVYGMPGAGKDTQSELLAEVLGVPHFSTGQILRDEVTADTELGRIAKPHLEAGTMIPNGVAAGIYRERLLDPAIQESGYIVNGYPRSVESLKKYLDFDKPTHIVHLVIPDELARLRLSKRARADDTPEVIEKRINRYYETEKAAADYARDSTDIPFLEIDSSASPDEVTRMLLELLK